MHIVTAWMFKIVQEGTSEVHAEMDVLLNLEQFRQAVPDNLACFVPYGTYILFERISSCN